MMKRKLAAYLVTLCLLLGVTGCAEKPEIIKHSEREPYPVTIQNITLEQAPLTVISLSPAATQALVELGFSQKLVAVSEDSIVPEELASLPWAGTQLLPNTEAILALAPDLLITAYPVAAKDMSALGTAGIQVLVLPASEAEDGGIGEYRQILALLNGNPMEESSQGQSSS